MRHYNLLTAAEVIGAVLQRFMTDTYHINYAPENDEITTLREGNQDYRCIQDYIDALFDQLSHYLDTPLIVTHELFDCLNRYYQERSQRPLYFTPTSWLIDGKPPFVDDNDEAISLHCAFNPIRSINTSKGA